MKKSLLTAVSMFVFLSASLISCKKDNEKSKNDQIMSGTWKLTNEENFFSGTWDSFYDPTDVCVNDNLFTFKSGGIYEVTEGATKCDPTDPDMYDGGVWEISADGKKIMFDGQDYDLEIGDSKMTFTIMDASAGLGYRQTYSR